MFNYTHTSLVPEIAISRRAGKSRSSKIVKQITCYCSRYKFPHRLGSGRCNGRDWAQSQSEVNSICQTCNCFNNGICKVATGKESIKYCDILEHYEYKP